MTRVHLPLLASATAEDPAASPPPNADIDCVVVGYNDLDFDAFAEAQKAMAQFSGAYLEAKSNSVRFQGRRITYMELLNQVLVRTRGVDLGLSTFESPSLGACHLAYYLRKRSYHVEIINLFNKEKARLASLLAKSPNMVAITTTYYVDPAPIADVVRFVREHAPRTRIVVGGPFINNLSWEQDVATQNYVLESIGADVYVIGAHGLRSLEGVAAALRDPERRRLEAVPNLILTTDNKTFHRTARGEDEFDIGDNAIDWRLFKEDFSSLPIYMRTSVSCPFTCSFCNFPAIAGEHRLASIESVMGELEQLRDAGVQYLVFIDDTFNVPLPRFKKLLRAMIERRFQFRWISFVRCTNADDETFDLMAESGCIAVFLGIESGDQTVLNYMAKSARIDKYRDGIAKLHARGIATYASIICGFPGETRESVMNTIRFIEETAPTFYNVQLYYHDIRTPIHAEAKKHGIQSAGYSWAHATMDWKEAAGWVEYMYRSIQNSIPLTLYGFSIWCLPYLLSKGVTFDQFKGFARIARELLIASFDERDADLDQAMEQMSALFPARPAPLGRDEAIAITP